MWGGEREHNDIMQSNTCSVDNILAILSSKKANILEALNLIGTSPTDIKFYHVFKLATVKARKTGHLGTGGWAPRFGGAPRFEGGRLVCVFLRNT